MNPNAPHYIIGASAGGLDELSTFFDHTPLDGVAYIIVQHLSPAFKSRMAELLTKHSQLSVRQAEQGMILEKNVVYMIPSDNAAGGNIIVDSSLGKGAKFTIYLKEFTESINS